VLGKQGRTLIRIDGEGVLVQWVFFEACLGDFVVIVCLGKSAGPLDSTDTRKETIPGLIVALDGCDDGPGKLVCPAL